MDVEIYVPGGKGIINFFGFRNYIPGKNARVTGRYKESSWGGLTVEFELTRFWIFKMKVWVDEARVCFIEPDVIYDCKRKA